MERFMVGIQVTILGMVVVLVILLVLYMSMLVLRRFAGPTKEETAPKRRMRPRSKPAQEPPAQQKQPAKHHDPKVIAAITAAVLASCEADAQPKNRALRLNREGLRQWKALGRSQSVSGIKP